MNPKIKNIIRKSINKERNKISSPIPFATKEKEKDKQINE